MSEIINRETLRELIRAIVREELAEREAGKEEYTEAECCKLVGISRTNAYRMRQRGKLNYRLIGSRIRYMSEHVRDFLQDRKRP